MNAQVRRISLRILAREPLHTGRGGVLGQVLFCQGCCCGREDKGFAAVPCDRMKETWKRLGPNQFIQLTISGCLGPCDVANVCCVMTRQATIWLGGLTLPEHYQRLIDWAISCAKTKTLQPLPELLQRHIFRRFNALSPGRFPRGDEKQRLDSLR